ncbi:hypothetical protein AJ87_21490 [Rhizobium yanglingense]|nr:hypothetical protein AJ87_21490 [Rhizobium yanglingense]
MRDLAVCKHAVAELERLADHGHRNLIVPGGGIPDKAIEAIDAAASLTPSTAIMRALWRRTKPDTCLLTLPSLPSWSRRRAWANAELSRKTGKSQSYSLLACYLRLTQWNGPGTSHPTPWPRG